MALTKIDSAMIAAGAIDADKIAGSVALGGPKISGLDYPGDDTAALPAGGQTIIVNGDNFQSGCTVYVDGTVISVVSFLSETQLQFVAPAKATGLYAFYVVNPDGGTAILVPGMVYSGTPTWTTASGSLGTPYETTAVSINLAATGDGALTYAVTSGSSLPTGLSLSSAGAITGTVPATANDTTYTFNIDVIDSENQSTTRQFSITYKVDVVTWSSPADGASFTVNLGQANTTALSATSAAGKSVSYSVQSGSLPTGITVSGSNISGTATVAQANTSVTIRATAATTNRFADRILYFIAQVAGWDLSKGANAAKYSSKDHGYDWYNPGIFLKSDGTQFYRVANKYIKSWNLSTAWDITSSTTSLSYTLDGIGTGGVASLFFKPDGAKFWVTDVTDAYNPLLREYSCSTPWNITTTSFERSYLLPGYQPAALFFKPDGLQFIISYANPNNVKTYTMTVAWDITTATLTRTTTHGVQSSLAIHFKNDGTKMYLGGDDFSSNFGIREFTLSSPWDTSTATLNYYLNMGAYNGVTNDRPGDMYFKPDGTRLYYESGTDYKTWQIDLS